MDQPFLPFSTPDLDRKTLRSRAIAAIGQHLGQKGAKSWKPLRAKFPDVPERTWWRWVASAKKARGKAQLNPAGRVPASASESVRFSDSEARQEFMKRQIRIADIAGAIVLQMRDIDLLQAYAMTEDGKIKFPTFFAQALALRERLMNSIVKTIAPALGQLEWGDMLDTVVDTIAGIDKDVALQIMKALHDVQQKQNSARH
jgi:hypothetical protein